MCSQIPDELRARNATQVPVKLVDKHDEPYVAPKRVIKPFSGAGHKLGKCAAFFLPFEHDLIAIVTAAS